LLRASGLLTLRPDRSLDVAGITKEQLRDLVATRILIEREALRLAIPQRKKMNILEAEQMQQRLELETDPAVLEELDKGFHAALYQPCKNLRLLALIGDLRSEHRRPYSDQPLGSATRARWKKDHRRILMAYVAGDVAAALAALEAHLSGLAEN
jgi:DNA-binding GntR family transcriptional regulator